MHLQIGVRSFSFCTFIILWRLLPHLLRKLLFIYLANNYIGIFQFARIDGKFRRHCPFVLVHNWCEKDSIIFASEYWEESSLQCEEKKEHCFNWIMQKKRFKSLPSAESNIDWFYLFSMNRAYSQFKSINQNDNFNMLPLNIDSITQSV